MKTRELVLILDFGAQDKQLLARRVRNLGVYCEVRPYSLPAADVQALAPLGILITGASKNQNDKQCDPAIFSLGIPVLDLTKEPEEIDNLQPFLFGTCKLLGDWKMADFAEQSILEFREQIGAKRVVLGLSGGVDSSVVAALLAKSIGSQLTCIFVDHGCMRKDEGLEVEKAFTDNFNLNFVHVDAEARFLSLLAGVTDPEKKRKIIGEEFIRVFEEEARKLGSVEYLAQGTIYPDILESGFGDTAVIKSHHNVGGLPERMDFEGILEPLRLLFKDEVRNLGRELGLPDYLTERQPFPGPGLAVRCIGELTKERLDILRDADAIFREELERAGLHQEISQYFAILTSMRSVGIKNEARTYDYTVALRAIITVDFMHAEFAKIPYPVLELVSERIVTEVHGVNRVVYDITKKPPATIEWE